jgi:predicted AlkP superfamily pyrophosphatase or phosphodiesterase
VVVISLDGFPARALDDPRLPVPTLRRLAKEGSAAAMRPVNPTVTWPNHTAMVTGVDAAVHNVLFNGLLTRQSGGTKLTVEPWRDKDLMVRAPTVYDLVYRAGLTTAQVDWVAIYGAKTITWQFPELPDAQGEVEKGLIAAGKVSAEQLRTFEEGSQAWQDQMWTAAAVEILEKHKPNLLLFHLLALDDASHAHGPTSGASFTAMAFLDGCVRQILGALERSGLAKQATVLVVSDHGFRAIQHKLHAGVLLGKSLQDAGQVSVVPEGGMAMVYAAQSDRKAAVVSEVRRIFANAEGVDGVYGVEEFERLGLPDPAHSDQAPDLVVAAAEGYGFTGETGSDFVTPAPNQGTHGYLNSDPDMQAIFIASGAGIKPGVRPGTVTNLDIAPTIASLLGLQMKNVKGRVIEEILRPDSSD